MTKVAIVLLAGALCFGTAAVAQDTTTSSSDSTVKTDMKDAGHATKDASKDVGHATATGAKDVGHATATGAKKVGHATKTTTKKVVHTGATKTEEGSQKVEAENRSPAVGRVSYSAGAVESV